MRAIEENNLYEMFGHRCLVPNVVIPKTFRVPQFFKYTGT